VPKPLKITEPGLVDFNRFVKKFPNAGKILDAPRHELGMLIFYPKRENEVMAMLV
jgi:hypothetical protein